MSRVSAGNTRPNAGVWDEHLLELGGHLLQSSRWGDFKTAHGWSVERIAYPDLIRPRAMAQILFKQRGPVSMGYIPRGPAFVENDAEALTALFREIDRVARRRRAISLVVEPNGAWPLTGTFRDHGFVRGPGAFQPARTVHIPLLDDDALLAQMHQKTRYSVRLATRRGVTVHAQADEPGIRQFYQLLQDTSERNQFGIHDFAYYRDFVSYFGDQCVLLLAESEGRIGSGLIAARFGPEAIYMYGASSTEHRAHGGAFLLQFTAMQWARSAGSTQYDLWGIPEEDPDSTGTEDGLVAGTRGNDWRGLYKFKTGFGGQIVRYPMTLERRYNRPLAMLARRMAVQRD